MTTIDHPALRRLPRPALPAGRPLAPSCALLIVGLIAGLSVGLIVGPAVGTASGHGPQDSRALFEEVQRLLQRGAFTEVVEVLEHAEQEHPYDEVIARALHWRVFALWRLGDESSLRRAAEELGALVRDHPDAAVRLDTRALGERLVRSLAERDLVFVAEEVETLVERLRAHAEATSAPTSAPDADVDDPHASGKGMGPGRDR